MFLFTCHTKVLALLLRKLCIQNWWHMTLLYILVQYLLSSVAVMSSYEAQRDDLLLYNAPQYRLRTHTPHPCVAIQIYETSARLIKQLTMSCNSIAAIESNQDANVFNASRKRRWTLR